MRFARHAPSPDGGRRLVKRLETDATLARNVQTPSSGVAVLFKDVTLFSGAPLRVPYRGARRDAYYQVHSPHEGSRQ